MFFISTGETPEQGWGMVWKIGWDGMGWDGKSIMMAGKKPMSERSMAMYS
jgi:hypothetical protein